MSCLIHRSLNKTAALLAYSLICFSSFTLFALAQEPAPFAISITPQADHAVSGQPFVYTIVITNISQQPVSGAVVTVRTPEGSRLVETHFANPDWFVGGINRGEMGEVMWLTQEPIAPNEGMTFELVVEVLPEQAGQQLVNAGYTAAPLDNPDAAASGPPIKTGILLPTAEPSPTRQVTSTPPPAVTATPPLVPKASTSPSTPTPTLRPTPTLVSAAATTPPSSATAQTTVVETSSSSPRVFVFIGLSILLLILIGLIWFWRYK